MSKNQMRKLYLALGLASLSSLSAAVDFSYSGFGNITAGRVLGATPVSNKYPDPGTWSDCPCAIVDFAHATAYEQRWALPESRLGLQGTANINSDLSFTSQLMVRSVAKKAEASIEWAFLSYNLSPSWTIQAGRKRTPLFFTRTFRI